MNTHTTSTADLPEVTTEEQHFFHAALADQISQATAHNVPSELNINIKNGVATLSGTSSSKSSSNMIEYLVSRITDVDHVINLITCRNQHTA